MTEETAIDLTKLITTLINNDHAIIICLDANEVSVSATHVINKLCYSLNLADPLELKHDTFTAPNTYYRDQVELIFNFLETINTVH